MYRYHYTIIHITYHAFSFVSFSNNSRKKTCCCSRKCQKGNALIKIIICFSSKIFCLQNCLYTCLSDIITIIILLFLETNWLKSRPQAVSNLSLCVLFREQLYPTGHRLPAAQRTLPGRL